MWREAKCIVSMQLSVGVVDGSGCGMCGVIAGSSEPGWPVNDITAPDGSGSASRKAGGATRARVTGEWLLWFDQDMAQAKDRATGATRG